MKPAFLHITTFKGSLVVWYAEHYYGSLRFGKEREDVRGVLTISEAKRLNKNEPGALFKYKPGDECSRFFDEDKLIRTAIKQFKANSRGYDLLIQGDPSYCEPQKILVGPKKLKDEANEIYAEFRELGAWNCEPEDEPLVRDLTDQWEKLVGKTWMYY